MTRATGEAAVHSVSKHLFSEHLLRAASQARDPAGKEASLTCPHGACTGKVKWERLTKAWRMFQKGRYRVPAGHVGREPTYSAEVQGNLMPEG